MRRKRVSGLILIILILSNIAPFFPSTPQVLAESEVVTGLGVPLARKHQETVLYAQGNYFVFYSTGTDYGFHYKNSSNGVDWGPERNVSDTLAGDIGSRAFSVTTNGTHLFAATTYDTSLPQGALRYNWGKIFPNGTIKMDSTVKVVHSSQHRDAYIALNGSGFPTIVVCKDLAPQGAYFYISNDLDGKGDWSSYEVAWHPPTPCYESMSVEIIGSPSTYHILWSNHTDDELRYVNWTAAEGLGTREILATMIASTSFDTASSNETVFVSYQDTSRNLVFIERLSDGTWSDPYVVNTSTPGNYYYSQHLTWMNWSDPSDVHLSFGFVGDGTTTNDTIYYTNRLSGFWTPLKQWDEGYRSDLAEVFTDNINRNNEIVLVSCNGSASDYDLWLYTMDATENTDDYVDFDHTNIDSSADKGSLVNFSDVQSAPDGVFTHLNETLTDYPTYVDFVDVDTSNVDGVADQGTHSSFTNEKSVDGMDTLTEEAVVPTVNSTAFEDDFEDQTFGKWDDNGATSWQIGTTGSGTGGSADPHGGTYDAWADETHAGLLTSDDIDLSGASRAWLTMWYNKDDTEPTDYTLYYYDGGTYDLIDELDDNGADDTWLSYINVSIASEYFISNYRIQLDGTIAKNENAWLDDVKVVKEVAGYHNLTLEVQFQDVSTGNESATLCIKTGTQDSQEDLNVSVWTDTGWELLQSGLTASSWNNITVTSYVNETMTIQYQGANETTSDDTESSWEIDAALLYLFNDTMRIDQEMSWSQNDNTTSNAEIRIYAGTLDSEDLVVEIWNKTDSSWAEIFSDLTASSWNNVSVKGYLTDNEDVYIRFIDGNMTYLDEDSAGWFLDSVLLYTWDVAGFAYTRDATQSISWSSSLYRDWTLTRVSTQGVGYSSSIYRTWSTTRLPAQSLSFSSDVYRDWTLTRVLSQAVSYSSALYRVWSLARTPTQAISYASNLFRTWSTSRIPTQGISYSSSIYRGWSLTRVLSQAISTSFQTWAEALIQHLRDAALSLSWSSQLTRTWSTSRLISQAISYSSSILKQLNLSRLISQAVSWSSQLTRGWSLTRTLTQSLSWSSQLYRTWGATRVISQAVNYASSIYRGAWTTSRLISQGIAYSSVVYRGWSLTRVATQAITTSFETWAEKILGGIQYLRDVTLGVSWSSQFYRTLALDRIVSHALTITGQPYRAWSLTRALSQALSSLFSGSGSLGIPPLPVVHTGGSQVFKRIAPSYVLTSLVSNIGPNAVEFMRNRFTPEITLSVTPDDKSIRYLALMLSIEKDDEVLLIEDTIMLYGEPVNVTYTPELKFSKGIIDLKEHKYHVTVVTTDLAGDSTRTEFYIPSSKPHTVLRTLVIVGVVMLFAIDLFFDEED